MTSVGTGDEGMESTLAGHWAGQRRASPCCILPPLPGQHPDWAAGTLAGRLWVASKLRHGTQASVVVLEVTPVLQQSPSLLSGLLSQFTPAESCLDSTLAAHPVPAPQPLGLHTGPPRTPGCSLTALTVSPGPAQPLRLLGTQQVPEDGIQPAVRKPGGPDEAETCMSDPGDTQGSWASWYWSRAVWGFSPWGK